MLTNLNRKAMHSVVTNPRIKREVLPLFEAARCSEAESAATLPQAAQHGQHEQRGQHRRPKALTLCVVRSRRHAHRCISRACHRAGASTRISHRTWHAGHGVSVRQEHQRAGGRGNVARACCGHPAFSLHSQRGECKIVHGQLAWRCGRGCITPALLSLHYPTPRALCAGPMLSISPLDFRGNRPQHAGQRAS